MTLSILVTGASGFIGRNLVKRLATEGHRVRAAARDPSSLLSLPVEPAFLGDLAGDFDWAPLVADMTHVVHLAGIAHATDEIPEATYQRVNAQASEDLAIACRGAGVRRLVLVSSVRAQVGPAATTILTERTPASPTDAYGRSKLAAEARIAHVLADGATDWVVLRPVVLYGPGVKGNVRTMARLAHTGLPLPLTALPGKRSLLGLANFSGAVAHVLTSELAARRTFLVADPAPLTIAEIVAALRRGQGRSPRLFQVPANLLRRGASLFGQGDMLDRLTGDLVVDTTALQSTGWRPFETAREGLERWQQADIG